MQQKKSRRPRCIAPLFVVAVLFSSPVLAAKDAAPPSATPPPALTPIAPPAAPLFARDPLGKAMLAFGFLGLLIFSGGASAGASRSRRRFEVQYRRFPYGSFYERRRAERDLH